MSLGTDGLAMTGGTPHGLSPTARSCVENARFQETINMEARAKLFVQNVNPLIGAKCDGLINIKSKKYAKKSKMKKEILRVATTLVPSYKCKCALIHIFVQNVKNIS